MWLYTRCDLVFEIAVPTPFVMMLRPRSGAQQWIASEQYRLTPSVPVTSSPVAIVNLIVLERWRMRLQQVCGRAITRSQP
jgi:hypothetical protein